MKIYLRIILLHLLIATCLAGYSAISKSESIIIDTPQNRTVKIAMAQIFCFDGDRAGNFVRIENAIIDAKKQGAEIVTFPESCILGWENPAAYQRAFPVPGEDSKKLCDLARKYQIYMCIGLDEKDGDKLYDAALLIDNEGNILLKHRKINVLPELMTPPYSTGNKVSVVKTKFGNIGILICADAFQKNLLDSIKMKQADLMLIPFGWAAKEEDWPVHGGELTRLVQNVSREVNCPVVGTDLIGQITNGPWTGFVYGGQSIACNKPGIIIKTGKDRERDIIIITIDLDK